jgi:hypothetical protein
MPIETNTYLQKEDESNETNHKKWRSILMICLIVALLATWSYIIWDKSQSKAYYQQRETQYSLALSEKDTLQNMLDEVTFRYDILKTTNIKKDSLISAKDKEIAEKKERIQFLLSKAQATKGEMAEAKRLIASLNSDLVGYKSQVETLKIDKIKLTQEKQMIIQQRDKVQKDFDSVTSVVKTKESIIDIGSTLHASYFSIIGINEKRNGREKETSTAKRVDKFRISFLIDENRITESGIKSIFVCITDPKGKIVVEDELGSGKFYTREDEEKFYTKRIDINYNQGQRQFVAFDWKNYDDFVIGDYKIEVYNNGFKIGEGIRSLKKGGIFD